MLVYNALIEYTHFTPMCVSVMVNPCEFTIKTMYLSFWYMSLMHELSLWHKSVCTNMQLTCNIASCMSMYVCSVSGKDTAWRA